MQIEGQQEPAQGQPVQDTSTRPVPNDGEQGTIELDSNPLISDHCVGDDRPIALRKGTRTCTKHPICNFVSFDLLSPVYRSFVSSLDQVQVPSTIEDAFRDPKLAFDEINAVENAWKITQLPLGKQIVGCK